MDRRGYLRTVGLGGTSLFAGCPALTGGDTPVRWEYRHGRPVTALAVGPEAAYVAGVPEGGRSTAVASVSLTTGDQRWTRELTVSGTQLELRWHADQLFLQNGQTLIVTPAGFTGSAWRRQGATPPVFDDRTAYLRTVAAGATWIEAVDLASGTSDWRVNISNRDQIPETQYPVAHAGSTIAVTDRRFPLTTRSLTDGTVDWRTDHATGAKVASTATTFYVGMEDTTDAGLDAYDSTTGDVEPILETAGRLTVPATVGDLLRVQVTGNGVEAIVVYDVPSRTRRWRVDGYRGHADWTTPERVYALDSRNRLVAFTAADGHRRWRVPLSVGEGLPRLSVTEDTVIVATPTRVTAIARQDGTIRWRRSIDRAATAADLYPIAAGAATFVYATGRTVRAVDPAP